MTTGEWFLGGATLFLALAASFNIWRDIRIRNKERKSRLMNEIIAWIKRGLTTFPEYARMENPFESKFVSVSVAELWSERGAILTAAQDFGKDFTELVKGTADILDRTFKEIADTSNIMVAKARALECQTSFTGLLKAASERKAKLKL